MTHQARIPNRKRDGWITINYRPGTLDEAILDEVWLGDSYHLADIAHVLGPAVWNDHKGGVVIDVGANIGAVTLRCLDLGARGVYAVEPEPENRALLVANINANPGDGHQRVAVVDRAVGDPTLGPVDMAGTSGDAYSVHALGGTIQVLGCDDLIGWVVKDLGDNEKIALLKVDVEGAEYAWFNTATPAMLARVDRVAMEWHGNDKPGYDPTNYGRLMTILAKTHSVSAFGDPETGGMLYAHRS